MSPPHGKSRARAKRTLARAATYGLLVVACIIVLSPIMWAASTSLKTAQEIHGSPVWIPEAVTFQNYVQSILHPKFIGYLFNSLLVFAGALIVSVGLAAHASYAVARRTFPGKSLLLFLVWATIMIPGVSIIVPVYLLTVDLGIYDTYFALIIVYSASLIPALIWLLRGFVLSLPVEVEEAAQVDGCSPLKIFYVIVLPLMRPGLGAAAVLVFVTIWNDFLIGFALTVGEERRMLQVGLHSFVTEGGINWGPMMAATVGSLVPAGLIFVLLQRAFVQGVTAGAVKG
jgi:ABC-type glycerol-3-phosphate transport system permease component